MPNPYSGDTTTTGARAGNAAYTNLSTEATDETNTIAEIPGLIGGGVITKIADTAGESGGTKVVDCLLYTSPSPRDLSTSRMPSSA